MQCPEVQALLPEYALGALSHDERLRVVQHLQQPCSACHTELAHWNACVAQMAETLTPIAPRAEVKQALMQRVESATPRNLATPAQTGGQAVAWRVSRWLPYVAASLLAMLVGAGVSALVQQTGGPDQLAQQGGGLPVAAPRELAGVSLILHTAGDNDSVVGDLFFDPVAQQVHVALRIAELPQQASRPWVWCKDRRGQWFGGEAESVDRRHVATVIDAQGASPELVEVVITTEPTGAPSAPPEPYLGRATLLMEP